MIVVHDENLRLQHVIYEHPPGYEDVIDDEGRRWLQTREAIPVDEIIIGEHPQYGHRHVYHRTHGGWLTVVAMDGFPATSSE